MVCALRVDRLTDPCEPVEPDGVSFQGAIWDYRDGPAGIPSGANNHSEAAGPEPFGWPAENLREPAKVFRQPDEAF